MVAFDPIFRDAVVFASLLSLLSIGLTLTYLTTRVPNFAHGSFATIGVYLSLTAVKVQEVVPYAILPLAFAVSGIVALGLYLLIMRPLRLRGASVLMQMIATLAFDLLLLAALNITADYFSNVLKITSRDVTLRSFDLFFANQPGVLVAGPTLAIVLVGGLAVMLTRTKFGTAMRATIENPNLSAVLGVNVNLVYGVSWFLAGGFGGVAGVMTSLWFASNPNLGSFILPSIFAASIVGGLFNIFGALVGGVLVGFAEILGTRFLLIPLGLSTAFRPIVPLIIISITLLIVPGGLFGVDWRRVRSRLGGKSGPRH
jgi:branched-chain amino acid transport system permease protein